MHSWARKILYTVMVVWTPAVLLYHLRLINDYRSDPEYSLNISCNNNCSARFKGWEDGMVTVLKPEIKKNCTKIFAGDTEEIKRTRLLDTRWRNELSDKKLLEMTKSCIWVQEYFCNNLYITEMEKSFPIAFTFVVYERPQQIMRLFKLLYRPHNFYCIHPDRKSSYLFVNILSNIAQCLDNVNIATKREHVVWGEYTIMKAQMNCLSDLVKLRDKLPDKKKWKYVVNLCGKELPLSTNHEMVSHMIGLNGSSDIDATKIPHEEKDTMARLKGREIPYDFPLYKGMNYMGLSYDFAHFLLTNSTASTVYDFFTKCFIPEEHFYSTLFMVPGVPGGYSPGKKYFGIEQSFWMTSMGSKPCSGKVVHDICIPTIRGLERIITASKDGQNALFHNKYFMEQDHVMMDCMEERLIARNKIEYEEDCMS